jgi:hypothetical protein
MVKYKTEKNEEKHRKANVNFENKNKEIEQISYQAFGKA